MRYRVEIRRVALRELRYFPQNDQARILDRAEELADNPRPMGCVKLEGRGDLYRIRCRDYRIIYEIRDEIVLVVVIKIGHPKDVYR